MSRGIQGGSPLDADVIVIGGGPAGSTVSTLIAKQGYRVELFEREHFPRFHIGESLIPETYWVLERLDMLPKMQDSHFVKKYSVQFVTPAGKLSEPFYFWDNKPHECSQTWQVRAQRVRPDDARQRARARRRRARRRARAGSAVRRRAGRRRRGSGRGRRAARRPARPSSSMPADRARLLMNRFELARVGSGAEEGRDLDVLEGRLPRHRPRRRRDAGAFRPPSKKGWFWYIPLHDDSHQRRRRRAVRLPVQGPRRSRNETYQRRSRALPRRQAAGGEAQRDRPAISRRRTIRTARRKSPATAGCWSATRSAFSIRSIRPACCSR